MSKNKGLETNPEILSRIASLNIRATKLVEGLLSGQHRSRHTGSSVEFADYKDYTPGDEIKHIDWKMVAKTDKHQIKQFEQSTNLKATILLDTSGSMGYLSPNPKTMNKMDYARTLVASLSYLLLKQYDAVGLSLFNEKLINHVPPRSKPSHFKHILHELAVLSPSGITKIEDVIESILERLHGRGILIIVSDFLTKESAIEKKLKLLVSRGLEVIIFHILDSDEVSFPFNGDIIFESLEDDSSIELDPIDIKETYQRAIQDQIKYYRSNCAKLGIDYIFLETTTPLEQGLTYYLLQRKNLGKI
jgi:uncharacterized protein (DUF58 family)